MKAAFLARMAGTVQEVLFEENEGAYAVGHTPNYIKVYMEGAQLHNQVRAVRLTEPYKDGMKGEAV
jgi:tRNA A37 methylthiotransferase MiaB